MKNFIVLLIVISLFSFGFDRCTPQHLPTVPPYKETVVTPIAPVSPVKPVIVAPIKKTVSPVPCVLAGGRYHSGKFIGKINHQALLTMKSNRAIKVRLNVGYCSYDGVVDRYGNVSIDTQWTPGGRVTIGVYNSDTGKYLSSVLI